MIELAIGPVDMKRCIAFVKEWCPQAHGFEIIGPPSWNYNCYANTFGERDQWLCAWDGENETWIRDRCEEEGWTEQKDLNTMVVPGQMRIVFYAKDGQIRHGARQLDDGRWESKLGAGPLIVHRTLECVMWPERYKDDEDEDCDYGEPYAMFVKPVAVYDK